LSSTAAERTPGIADASDSSEARKPNISGQSGYVAKLGMRDAGST
jgi:hypothetical protein